MRVTSIYKREIGADRALSRPVAKGSQALLAQYKPKFSFMPETGQRAFTIFPTLASVM